VSTNRTSRPACGEAGAHTGPVGRLGEAEPLERAPVSPLPRVDILGVEVTATTLRGATDEILRWCRDGERHYVCVSGVHGVMESVRDPSLRAIHNRSGVTTTDGMPLVWCCRLAGRKEAQRVYGPDLMLAVCAAATAEGLRSFFYGGAPGVADQLAVRLQHDFPGLRCVGTWSPPFRPLTPEEEEEVAERINRSGADLVWVGLSTPKQERWMATLRDRLDAPALLGVGAAFDMHAGLLRQAPPWVQRHGLEWAFRLAVEPRRLWRRYLRNNPAFVWGVLRRPPRIVGR
jgi:N-acetylglucosaminyldiphosphoundecaprenol N-acetyl-beta-D-mannosaminyltransferase